MIAVARVKTTAIFFDFSLNSNKNLLDLFISKFSLWNIFISLWFLNISIKYVETSPALKALITAQAYSRMAVTALRPAGYPRNYLGAMIKSISSGNVSISAAREAHKSRTTCKRVRSKSKEAQNWRAWSVTLA